MKKVFFPLFSIMIFLLILFSTTPPVAAETDERTEAHKAYYEYLTAEIEGIGGAVRDMDYYEMFTDKIKRPAITEKILAVYLVDVTNDGIEELIIKRYVTHESGAIIDLSSAEWIGVYSYDNGQIRRIGQNLSWICSVGDGSWSYYEPDGYIGSILSSWKFPYISDDCITLCWAEDGQIYFCDGEMLTITEGSFSFYGYNGTYMERTEKFQASFIPDWSFGSVESEYGHFVYSINGGVVDAPEFHSRLAFYKSKGTYELRNNDYHEVLNLLSDLIQGKDVPFGDANPHCHIPSEDWVRENDQHYRICQSGCDVKLDLASCSGGTASCIQKATCSVCQQNYGDFAEHVPSYNYSFADGQHFFPCKTTGCTQTFNVSDCTDHNKDHKCDSCRAYMGTHAAADNTHTCSYCNQPASACEDGNTDHMCDICASYVGVHEAAEGTHTCLYCNLPVSTCEDYDTDHTCDVCDALVGTHEAAEGTHACAYCHQPASDCIDNNLDHQCDVCDAHTGIHEAEGNTHVCAYCNQLASECEDNNKDQTCDICGKDYLTSPTESTESEAKNQTGCVGVITGIALHEILLLAMGAFAVFRKRKTQS